MLTIFLELLTAVCLLTGGYFVFKRKQIKSLMTFGVPLFVFSVILGGFFSCSAVETFEKKDSLFDVRIHKGEVNRESDGDSGNNETPYMSLLWMIPSDTETAEEFESVLLDRLGEHASWFAYDYPWFKKNNLKRGEWIVEGGEFVEDFNPVYIFDYSDYAILLTHSEVVLPLRGKRSEGGSDFIESFSYELIVRDKEGNLMSGAQLKELKGVVEEVIEICYSPETREDYLK